MSALRQDDLTHPGAGPDQLPRAPFYSILQCPITGETLRQMRPEEIADLNRNIERHELFHFDGTLVGLSLSEGLVTNSGKIAFPVIDSILVLLPSLAIPLNEAASTEAENYKVNLRAEKQLVQNYYDQVGWRKGTAESYGDAERFEDLRPVVQEYVHRCHMRVKEQIPDKGTFILDAASGPIQYSEYMTYSEDYQYRVCLDISIQALREAQSKLGDKGIYLLADMAHLPLQDQSMDSVVSLHTLYHVPKDEQDLALNELVRVTRLGGTAVVVYSWGAQSRLMRWFSFPIKFVKFLRQIGHQLKHLGVKHTWDKRPAKVLNSSGPAAPHRLYFHAFAPEHFTGKDWGFPLEIRVWRSVGVAFTRALINPWFFGKFFLRLIYQWEENNPHFAGRIGQYPMLVIKKSPVVSASKGDV